jgi:UDP-2,3-diacylglucosamine hydrolase
MASKTTEDKKYFFASDFHLGAPDYESSLEREKKIVRWLDEIKPQTKELFILGDVFDFWFEYKTVVPRGFTRILGKLAELSDSGIPIHWFIGNHDMWIFDYIPREIGVTLHKEPITKELFGKNCYIGHGDGLGPGDHGYKFIKKVFRAPLCQWLFARIHPNAGISLANFFSGRSRNASKESDKVFLGADEEWLAIYSEEISASHKLDYLIFGHRHLPMEIKLKSGAVYFNIGDWISNYTFGVLDQEGFRLESYDSNPKVYRNS